jgi:sterol desaturase/sphingolipid hydroxylase (fatty acid hydroxylase superfamily)
MLDFQTPGSEGPLRLILFVSIFAVMALSEAALPKRDRERPRTHRWFTNLGIAVIDTLAVRLVFPLAAVGIAVVAEARGWGLFNHTAWPGWLEGLIAFLALDFAIYVQHVAAHKIPVLWRLHRVHHADPEIDVTTGIRFHPVEIVLSMGYKVLVVMALGAPALAVFIFEVVLNGCALFNHANVRIPERIDAAVRLLIVTPDMHRVHHSTIRRETDSNYGFNLSLWDRLFRTYIAQPERGHSAMTIGLDQFPGAPPTQLGWSLVLPFRRA